MGFGLDDILRSLPCLCELQMLFKESKSLASIPQQRIAESKQEIMVLGIKKIYLCIFLM